MRPLGISMKGVNESTGLVKINNSTMAELVHEWNVWETQTMVVLSFMLQLFLLGNGNLRRRYTNGALKASIWLAYVGADLVAVYALGLFSQYEDRYKRGRESFGDTLPFLWVPFLLVHLGGQDSITAFSLEDNNLWQRHLLNLATQGVLALYAFWKSFHRINYSILVPAMFVFVSGIIKYGERVWALKSASRNGLGESVKLKSSPGQNNMNEVYPSKESYALRILLLVRGFFVGRTMFQLGDGMWGIFVESFHSYGQGEGKLKMVVMELGMMFDLLYTKANVLQRWTGVLFRCASQTLMVVAFVLFLISEKGAHNHNRVNVAITYTLFTGAIFMEACSVAAVMASPWTRAHLNGSSFLHGLYNFATSLFKAVQCNKGHRTLSSTSMGQFNYMDYCITMKYNPRPWARIMSKAICAIGLDKQWRNLWYVHRIYDASRAWEGIISGVMEILGGPGIEESGPMNLGQRLNDTLFLPFEQALYRLHILTDLHISSVADTNSDENSDENIVMQLKKDCETLSNYMMYLMVVHPSMLPISAAAEDLEPALLKWFTSNHRDDREARTKLQILEDYRSSELKDIDRGMGTCYPFQPEQINGSFHLEQSLKDIKAMWLRLLMYAAGKCSGEVHARQLSEGGELITIVWLLMVHHGLGDVAQELSLFTSDAPNAAHPRKIWSLGNENWTGQQPDPLYVFKLRKQQADGKPPSDLVDTLQMHARQGRPLRLTGTQQDGDTAASGGASEQYEAGISGKAGRDDNASEIDDQAQKAAIQNKGSQQA